MIVFFFLMIALVVVVAAVTLAVAGGGSEAVLPEAEPDRVADRLPETRPVVRADIDALRLPVAPRGYRMAEVDDVLERLAAELAERDARIARLTADRDGGAPGEAGGAPGDEPADAAGAASAGGQVDLTKDAGR
ncbi:DivIVA domain-containing protein [Streptomyces antarcticus]|uniref:DivIVA domain-containing protein n=1 Tax=Streptomyces antarcticus TaxID=2996458 RepID=UPI00226E575A|nr:MULTISPECIES: DivIVA domain-containing protein [unclassified Streptomyces]MCY0940592.1 DivIVA domain-containing protein [Streptomyces sp. H34-AA3]MCY0948472.1 DivIVA domain-containing protein [Streptomyces sp. H27-S2]MCZ4085006.1 DivIVA domain-containing protein [Streptomyces sp. H34-S5]